MTLEVIINEIAKLVCVTLEVIINEIIYWRYVLQFRRLHIYHILTLWKYWFLAKAIVQFKPVLGVRFVAIILSQLI